MSFKSRSEESISDFQILRDIQASQEMYFWQWYHQLNYHDGTGLPEWGWEDSRSRNVSEGQHQTRTHLETTTWLFRWAWIISNLEGYSSCNGYIRAFTGRYEPTINKRTPLMGKAGPDKRKREDYQIESILDVQRLATHKQVRDLISLVVQLVKNTDTRKIIRDKDAKEIATVEVSTIVTTTDAKVVGTANRKDKIMLKHCNMQTRELLLDRRIWSQGRSSTSVDQATKAEERILDLVRERICSLMEARCLCLRSRDQMRVTTIIHQIKLRNITAEEDKATKPTQLFSSVTHY